jgi:hypothetical protein
MLDQVFSRIVVLDVIVDPSMVTDALIEIYQKKYDLFKITKKLVLPRNTILGRRIMDREGGLDQAMFFAPFFPPHLSLPCNPGEHVWALFSEGDNYRQDIGYWFCRITEILTTDDLNHTHPPRSYEPSYSNPDLEDKFEFNNGIPAYDNGVRRMLPGSKFIKNGNNAYRDLVSKENNEYVFSFTSGISSGGILGNPIQFNASNLKVPTSVPRYKKRPGDIVLEGSNNTLISLGTDRKGPVANFTPISILVKNNSAHLQNENKGNINIPSLPTNDLPYGSIDIVAGRGKTLETGGYPVVNELGYTELNKSPKFYQKSEGDPDPINDSSRIRISEKTNVDSVFNLEGFNGQFSFENSANGDPAIVIKTDKLRLIARKDVEILVSNNDSGVSGSYAAIVIKTNGDIIFKPSSMGFIKLGGDDATRAILCTSGAAVTDSGIVSGLPIISTMGGQIGGATPGPESNSPALAPANGTFASKVLVK